MISNTSQLQTGSRIVAWSPEYKGYFAIAVTKVSGDSCQGTDKWFNKHTGLKFKGCWWPDDFRTQKPQEYARLFPSASPAKQQENTGTVNPTVNTLDIASLAAEGNTNLRKGKPEQWNPKHFGECPRKAEESGQLTIFWDNSDEPPEPDDYPDLDSYEKAWAEWEAKQSDITTGEIDPKGIWAYWAKEANKCGNSICAAELAQASLSPVTSSAFTSEDSAKLTSTVGQSSSSDIQASQYSPMFVASRGMSMLISSRRRHHASHFLCKVNAWGRKIREIASRQYLKRSPNSSPDSSPLKTCGDYSVAPARQETNSSTLIGYRESFPPAGTISNGKLFPQPTLERPGVESGCLWLESPNALSSTGNGRPPGNSRLEGQLKKLGALQPGEVCNPEFLESAYQLPIGWTNPADNRSVSEFLAATVQHAIAEPPLATPLIQESPSAPSEESSTSTALPKTTIKALTLHQPWASVIGVHKFFETRSWPTSYRGKIAIHAAAESNKDQAEAIEYAYETIPHLLPPVEELKFGVIVAIADLTDCCLMTEEFISQQSETELSCGLWELGRYAWKLEDIQILKEPIPARGAQGVWNIDLSLDDLKQQEEKQNKISFLARKPASGWLEKRTERKKLKDGTTVLYPKVEGFRDPTDVNHWYWSYNYEVKSCGKYRKKCVRIPNSKVESVEMAIKMGWVVEKILQYLKGEL